MPAKKYGKYQSRRKKKKKEEKKEEGGGILGDIGYGLNEVGKFVEKSGKDVTKVASKVASAGGDAVKYIGTQIKDKKVSKAFKDVGTFSSGTAKNVVNFLGEASPYIGKAGQWVGKTMMKGDEDYENEENEEKGGGLFDELPSLHDKFAFENNDHASGIVEQMTNDHHHAIKSAARYISNMPYTVGDLVMLHHRPSRNVGLHHFEKIASSTPESLVRALKNDKTNELHKAVQTSAHSATTAGGFEFNHARHHEHHDGSVWKGGGFALDWDKVGKEFGKASTIVGKVGLAASPVVSLVAPELGVPMAAVSGAALGIGQAVNNAYK